MERLRGVWQFLKFFSKKYFDDGCPQSAAALTYMSLFAVVPLMTVAYSMISSIPSFQHLSEDINHFIFNNFLPNTGEEIQAYLLSFSSQARKLTVIGIIFLAVTAYLMLKNIETTFNAIWHTRTHRKGMTSFLLYWAVLSLGPLLIGAGFAISTYILSLTVVFNAEQSGATQMLLRLAPLALETATFTLLFAAVPNTRVPLRHALWGGFATGACFEIAKAAFTYFAANANYQLIYGTFAAVPLFLLWIYLSWLLVLGGAEFVHSLSSFQSRSVRHMHPLLVAVALLKLFYDRHREGLAVSDEEVVNSRWLLARLGMPSQEWQQLRNDLVENRIVRITNDGNYVLGRDLDSLSLWELAHRIPGALQPMVPSERDRIRQYTGDEPPHWLEELLEHMDELAGQYRDQLGGTLHELFRDSATITGEEP